MLQKLLVKNFIIIDNITINFKEGLTVLSGETGAGKSIILDAIKLLLSKKTEKKIKKDEQQSTIVELTFDNNNQQISKLLTDHSIEIEDDILILKKAISKNNKVSTYINDYNVSVKLLSKILSLQLEIHGQHDNNDLFDNNNHIKFLDYKLKNQQNLLKQLTDSYNLYHKSDKEHKALKLEEAWYIEELEQLNIIITDLNKFKPLNSEFEELLEIQIKLKKTKNLQELYQKYYNNFTSPNGIQEQILTTQKDLMNNLSSDEENLSEILNNIEIMLKSCDNIVEKLQDQNDYSQYNLDDIEERISGYKTLARKYSLNVLEIENFHQESISKQQQITEQLSTLKNLDQTLELLQEKFLDTSNKVTIIRQEIAFDLEKEIHNHLKDLYMDKTVFKVEFYDLDKNQWSSKGNKKVVFEVSTNPGKPYEELTKIASGGELSRFMLALKLSLISDNKTLIFDEIDTGISGRVSEAVGSKLSTLSNNNQTIIITHQPQVASKSNHHLKIIKSHDNNITDVKIEILSANEKIEEIARMISGKNVTEKAREVAQQIINS